MNNFNHMLMHSNALYDVFQEHFKETPIDHWGYYCYDYEGHYFQLESDKEFFKDFLEKKLYVETPIYQSRLMKYQFYSSVIGADPKVPEKLSHLLKSHGYYSFVNIIHFHSDYTAILTMGSKKHSFDMINYVMNNEAKILNISHKIHEKLYPLFKKQNCIILPADLKTKLQMFQEDLLRENAYKEKGNIASRNNLEAFNFSSLPFDLARYNFTAREKDIIYLLFHGFNTKESADILDLSPRTIERNFASIRKKTNTSNKLQILNYLLKAP
ncbi:helix-turn-helix transcriptional regulator [Legionella israelensis]|uniref:LuxR family transcriptional regulator n=1 Tax=Legionella israelensis TaxID=454 RepID=A0A0W0WB02_9GAMM|nr:helix-turn-helix transcriptional regulator [Legionella israelensis]KTD29427.1 LuxR family transcriptional regulator [Legionella israelensis]QBS09605.1 LuxR family transcriptional regulator [Legionella israelensis]QDP71565.1 helix-turn-helix transcriptional regulator [Legionella israelensis]SCY59604.1 regulatory protein, luxR family [Legionella israelensis DSM 19235]STX60530.1 LuxR family transcriptional regulator [Legionella israelensis]